MTFRIYTKTGDGGETGLFGGSRVGKDSLRVCAYGDVDELNAVLGLVGCAAAEAGEQQDSLAQVVLRLQSLMFELGAELATAPEKACKSEAGVTEDDILWLEQLIDGLETELPTLKSFILPGGSRTAASLHLARTVCRRAERRCVRLLRAETAGEKQAAVGDPDLGSAGPRSRTAIVVRFLNRLSDALFVCARYANHSAGVDDVKWAPR